MNFYLIGSLEGFNDLRFPNVEDWQNCMGHAEGLLKQWNPPEMEYIWKKSNRHKHFDLSQFCNPLLTISDKALSILENILIKNGVVVDPIFKTQEQRDVYIQSGRIASAKNFTGADIVIDASGNLVVPGLIDFHSHVFADGTEIGIEPDLSFIPQGVTTAVDAGSTGIANFECFKKDVIQRSKMRIKAFVNLCPCLLYTSPSPRD